MRALDLMWYSRLDCVVLKETTQLKITQEVRMSPDLPGPLILNPVFFFPGQWTTLCSGPMGQPPRQTHLPRAGQSHSRGPQARQGQTWAKPFRPANCSSGFSGTPVGELGASTAGFSDKVSVSGLDRMSLVHTASRTPHYPTLHV